MPQLEGPTTKIYNCVQGGIWGEKAEKEKEEDWQQLLAQVPIFKKKKKSWHPEHIEMIFGFWKTNIANLEFYMQ